MPDPRCSHSPVLRATYRFQFNEHFRLQDARALLPYLQSLGISHVYASPLFGARPHSTHGYDVCDFSRLNSELGTEDDLNQLVSALRGHGMGLVLDIVPNHMGIGGPENAWWWDVLEKGQGSRFANHFDIDWEPPDPRLYHKVLAPVLGDRYGRILAEKKLKVKPAAAAFRLHYYDWQFPISAGCDVSQEALAGQPEALDKLIQQQHYLLTSANRGDTELNYRRFFAVNTLAAVCVENERVFHDVHRLVRRWMDAGWIDGLRVDHPDGLRDPQKYLERLRSLAPKSWIIVEKILQFEESLPVSWPVAGTTGYDFLNMVNGLFIDPAAEQAFTRFYVEFTREPVNYAGIVSNKKRFVLGDLLAAEVKRLTGILVEAGLRYWQYRDFTRSELSEAIIELAACLQVYRTYIRPENDQPAQSDLNHLLHSLAAARENRPDLPAELFDFLGELLSLKLQGELEAEFVARFQQLTGAAMAKGVEDTAFYCFNRFISLNEVGGDPGQFGCSVEMFHRFCRHHQEHWPEPMLTSSTHDTKRSEDVRARLNVLSEIPGQWFETIRRWSALNERYRTGNFPDRNIEYHFYQTLVGAWPLSLDRVQAFMEKAACEAAQHTSWKKRNETYHDALRKFVAAVLGDAGFIADLGSFIKPVIQAGYVNSLAQTLLKLTAPGVPDIYQGCELWDFSLVDPDNRRPVDFRARQTVLDEVTHMSAEEAWRRRDEGVPKLWLIRRILKLREHRPELFDQAYQPVTARGPKSDRLASFMRGNGLIVSVPRLTCHLEHWNDTVLEVPDRRWRNELTGERMTGRRLHAGSLFQRFPVALISSEEGSV